MTVPHGINGVVTGLAAEIEREFETSMRRGRLLDCKLETESKGGRVIVTITHPPASRKNTLQPTCFDFEDILSQLCNKFDLEVEVRSNPTGQTVFTLREQFKETV